MPTSQPRLKWKWQNDGGKTLTSQGVPVTKDNVFCPLPCYRPTGQFCRYFTWTRWKWNGAIGQRCGDLHHLDEYDGIVIMLLNHDFSDAPQRQWTCECEKGRRSHEGVPWGILMMDGQGLWAKLLIYVYYLAMSVRVFVCHEKWSVRLSAFDDLPSFFHFPVKTVIL